MLLTDAQLYDSCVLHLSISTETYLWRQLLSNGGNLFVHLIIYFLSNISIRKNNRRLYLSKRFCISMFNPYLHILVKKWNTWFSIVFLKSKHKIYILLKNDLMRICRPYLGKNFLSQRFFRISHILFKKCNFRILIVFFKIKRKKMRFFRNCDRQNLQTLLKWTVERSDVITAEARGLVGTGGGTQR